MPIHQSRVIDLLAAALDWKHAFDEKSRLMDNLARELNNRQLSSLASFPATSFLRDPVQTNTTIALETERIHHTKTYNETRRNNKAKEKAKKEAEAAIPSIQSPEDIEELELAKQAGFNTWEEYQNYLFNSATEETK
jgi:hypothetical protein